MVVFYANFVEEDFVEACATGHLLEWAYFNIWIFEVDNESSEALVLWQVPVGASHDFTNV